MMISPGFQSSYNKKGSSKAQHSLVVNTSFNLGHTSVCSYKILLHSTLNCESLLGREEIATLCGRMMIA